jgi:hypothetical protein
MATPAKYTYARLVSQIEALMGATLLTTELGRVKFLINSRIHDIYRESDFWENHLVTEQMSVDSNNVIPFQGAVAAATAGVNNANTGDVDTFLRVHKDDPYGGTKGETEYEFFAKNDGAQLVGYVETLGQEAEFETGLTSRVSGGTLQITVADNQMDLYVGANIVLSGFSTGTIDANLTFQISTVSYSGGSTSITVTSTGLSDHTFSLTGDEVIKIPTAFVTYKKVLTGTIYGDGTDETSDVPVEFFDYAALGTYADMMAADGFHEKALSWEGMAGKAKIRELGRIDKLRAFQTVGQRIRTHSSSQPRSAG